MVSLFLLSFFAAKAFAQCASGFVGVPPYCTDQWVVHEIAMPNSNDGQITGYALSDDGTTLVFQTMNNVYIYNISSTSAPVLANSFSGYFPFQLGSPTALSTDGSKLTFTNVATPTGTPSYLATSVPSFATSSSATNIWADPNCNWFSIAASGDGNTVAAIPGTQAWETCLELFTYNSGSWSTSQYYYGNSVVSPAGVAVSGDGSVFVVGFSNACGSNSYVNVFVVSDFLANPSSYSPATISAPDGSFTFGDFVSISDNGSVIVVGDDGEGNVYIYDLVDGSYQLSTTLSAPSGFVSFAQGVDYSSDSGSVIVGGSTSSQNQFVLYDASGNVELSGPGVAVAGMSTWGTIGGSSPAVSADGRVVIVQDLPGDTGSANMWVYQHV